MTLTELLQKKNRTLLNIYFTAGYPEINSLPLLLGSLENAGADMIEIGIPYSDPISDGPIIQQSNNQALENGITLELIFKQLEGSSTKIPKIMMGYFNPIFQFGMEKFCKRCAETDISGLIIPDLPIDLWENKYQKLFEQYGLSNIFLITPETSEDRIKMIDDKTTSFIYAVSSSGTTGTKKGIAGAENYLKKIQQSNLKSPVLVGFNISSPEDFQFACQYTNGAIIGSAFIKHLKESEELEFDTKEFIQYIKK